jgi:hypothetical protein
MDRLRWDNIARAVAVLAVIALIVAWPHLRRRDPAMPLAAPTPVSVEQPPAVAEEPPPVEQTPARKPRLKPVQNRRPRQVKWRVPAPRRRHAVRPPTRVTPRPQTTPRPVASPPPAPPAPPRRRPVPPQADQQGGAEFAIP